MKKILVLCTGNSCRSQMAEGYLRFFTEGKTIIKSAGIEVHGLDPRAIEIMKEDGIDISNHTSNHLDEYVSIAFDFVITVCDHANERCPIFPESAMKIHNNFPDPAKAVGDEVKIHNEFRKTRDLIKEYCKDFAAKHLID